MAIKKEKPTPGSWRVYNLHRELVKAMSAKESLKEKTSQAESVRRAIEFRAKHLKIKI